jgi:hypothetical protein
LERSAREGVGEFSQGMNWIDQPAKKIEISARERVEEIS